MRIEWRIGDVLKGPYGNIAHGCNAQGVMGSGIAGQIHDDYPEVYKAYRETFEDRGLKLGQVIVVRAYDRWWFNCITQEYFGSSRRHVNYGAVQECIRGINSWVKRNQDIRPNAAEIAFPMIGAGLGGGDWPTIQGIIERESQDFVPVVYDF